MTVQEVGGKYYFLTKLMKVSHFNMNSHKINCKFYAFSVAQAFVLGQFVFFPVVKVIGKKPLNSEVVSKVKVKHGGLVSCLGFDAI